MPLLVYGEWVFDNKLDTVVVKEERWVVFPPKMLPYENSELFFQNLQDAVIKYRRSVAVELWLQIVLQHSRSSHVSRYIGNLTRTDIEVQSKTELLDVFKVPTLKAPYTRPSFHWCIDIYAITWLLCAFSLVVDRDLLEDTHRWRQIHVRSRQQTCFSFFMPPKYFNKPFEFLLYKTNRLHFPVRVYCNRSQKTSQRVKNNSHTTRLRLSSCCLHAVTSSVIYYSTHTRENVIYLLSKDFTLG